VAARVVGWYNAAVTNAVAGGRGGVLVPAVVATAVHLVLDLATSRLPLVSPPYLLLDHAAGPFRELLAIGRGTVLVAVSVAASGVNGLIAGLFGVALEGARRRVATLGLLLAGLWIFSGGLLALVYLSLPGGLLAGSLLAGVPRAFAVAWSVDRVLPRRAGEGQR
jgi:hypothetical protein